MKKLLIKIFIFLFISACLFSNFTIINTFATPTFEAEGVVLMDAKSGQILFSKNPYVQYEPASITKVMTAIVVLENSNINDKVTIGKKPTLVDGSALGIAEGEVYTVEELLFALLLSSSNDSAEALAEYIAGSNYNFAKLMNEKAKELGANNTNFKNPSGLPQDGHLTTAYDMALIMKHALSNDDFIRISQTDSYFFENHPFSDGSEKWAVNGNHCFLDWSTYYYENLYTGKTGWTSSANHNYVSAAIKDDSVLIATFLNATNKDTQYRDVSKLYDFGFDNFTNDIIVNAGEVLGDFNITDETNIPILAGEDIYYSFANGEKPALDIDVDYNKDDLELVNISEGDFLFNGTILVNGLKHSTVEILSGSDIVIKNSNKVIVKSKNMLFKNYVLTTIAIISVIIFLILIYRYYLKRKRRKRRGVPSYIFHKKY